MMEEKEVLVKVEGLSKKFCKDLKTSLWYGVKDLFSGLSGNHKERNLRDKEFWAVKDISFELRRGECLGLIGHNGAGKSTLLKMLNGLINPDAGKITIKGKMGALIELGAGFNPILSGRENIYNNGAILGFTRKEIEEKLEEIIDFAEIREFIDMPVQHYSSGMKVRLGFAVAAQMEPDVLLIDEVLAVGDLGFILKCFKRIDAILPTTAIIFVSHNMPQVSRLCDKVMVLERGKEIYYEDDVAEAIDLYYSRFSNNESNVLFDDGSIVLEKVELCNANYPIKGPPQILWGSSLKILFSFRFKVQLLNLKYLIEIVDIEQKPVAIFEENPEEIDMGKNLLTEFSVEHTNLQLSKGIYTINIHVSNGRLHGPILRVNNCLEFQIKHDKDVWHPFLLSSKFTSLKEK